MEKLPQLAYRLLTTRARGIGIPLKGRGQATQAGLISGHHQVGWAKQLAFNEG
jgi:hypothetical protein